MSKFKLVAQAALALGFGWLHSTAVHAGTVKIPTDAFRSDKDPAVDLIYQGKPIDHNQAAQLLKKRFDLSQLDPQESLLWRNQALPASNQDQLGYPQEGAILVYDSSLPSPGFSHRISVDAEVAGQRKAFTASFSTDSHAAIIRAGILRRIGFSVDVPKYYKKLTIRFPDVATRDSFIQEMADNSRTDRSRWVLEAPEGKPEITVKGAVLEPGRLRTVNVHWGRLTEAKQKTRRIFRSLIAPFVLVDLPQAVNAFSWTTGRIRWEKDEQLGEQVEVIEFTYIEPDSSNFKDVTIDDYKWIMRRIARLSKADFAAAVSASGVPQDIGGLIVERLASRRDRMLELANLHQEFSSLKPDTRYTNGNVKNGQLTKADYEGYAVLFHEDAPENPFRMGELYRYFKNTLMWSGLSGLLDFGSKKIPGLRTEDAAKAFGAKLADAQRAFIDDGGDMQDYTVPLDVHFNPILNAGVSANRSVVFGQYMGMEARTQLVDAISRRVELGAYGLISGVKNSTPSIGAIATMNRSYVHVRPIEDLKSLSEQKLTDLMVPKLMKRIAGVLDPEIKCELPDVVWTEDVELGGEIHKHIKVDWDKDHPDYQDDPFNEPRNPVNIQARAAAEALRSELIAAGVPDTRILMIPVNRDEECTKNVEKSVNDNVEAFLKQLGHMETFMISDQVDLSGRLTAPMSLPVPVVGRLNVSLANETSKAFLRSTIFRKTTDGVEVIIQKQRKLDNTFSEGLTYFIRLVEASQKFLKGEAETHIFKIKVDEADTEGKKKVIQAIKMLLRDGSDESLRKNFTWYEADHEVRLRLNTLNILWWKREKLRMTHDLELSLPTLDENGKRHSRQFFYSMYATRRGSDYYGFFNKSVSSMVPFFSLGSSSSDPGDTIKGKSERKYVMTEAELTPGSEYNPVSRLEYYWNGWSIAPADLSKVFDEIEGWFQLFLNGRQLFDDRVFSQTRKFMGYEVRSAIFLYPGALQKIESKILNASEGSAYNILRGLYGAEKWNSFCKLAMSSDNVRKMVTYELEKPLKSETGTMTTKACVPQEMQVVLDLRRQGLGENRRTKTERWNKLIRSLVNASQMPIFLQFIGPQNFYAESNVSGFRTQDPTGYTDYESDTVGTFNERYGRGIYDQVSRETGISNYELRALQFTPGM